MVSVEKNTLEVKIPGGKLVAFAGDEGGDYPGIGVYFESEKTGRQYDVCFAEHIASDMEACQMRAGLFYTDGDVHDVYEFYFSKEGEDA